MPQIRPFVVPPRSVATPPFLPDPDLEAILANEGPPPLPIDPRMLERPGGPLDPAGMPVRGEIAANSPAADWMYQPMQPDQGAVEQALPPIAARYPAPPEKPGGLRRGLARALPVIRNIAYGASVGSQQPDFMAGLGAGIESDEARQRKEAADRAAAVKEILDIQKAEREAAKTQGEIEKAGAETREIRQRTELMPSKEQADRELKTQQAASARDAATLSRERAAVQREIAKAQPELSAAEVELKTAQAVNFRAQARYREEEMKAGLPWAEADLRASQRLRNAWESVKTQAEVEQMGEELGVKRLMADAQYQNSLAALQRANALAQQGTLRPADAVRVRANYETARTRLIAARTNASSMQDRVGVEAVDRELRRLETEYGPLLRMTSGALSPQAPAPATVSPAGQRYLEKLGAQP